MVRVGLGDAIKKQWLDLLPEGIEIISLHRLEEPVSIDIWIPPLTATKARQQWPLLRGVKVIQSLMAGVDGLLHFLPADVTLCDARGVHDIAVAEWIMGAIFAMNRNVKGYASMQQRRVWDERSPAEAILFVQDVSYDPPPIGRELTGSTVLIVGYGSIGSTLERFLAPFGCHILRIARSPRPDVASLDDLPELLKAADIVVVTLPLTAETRGLFRAEQFAMMRAGTLFVNASRGAIVQTEALEDVLRRGVIRVATDVVDPEPLPAENALWDYSDLLITPHIASDTEQTFLRAFRLVGEQIQRFQRKEPLWNEVKDGY